MATTAKPMKPKPRPLPTGYCFCGCGEQVALDKFQRPKSYFRSGHDRTALFRVVAEQYGDILNFLIAHHALPPEAK